MICRGIGADDPGRFKDRAADSFGIIQSHQLRNGSAPGMSHDVDAIQLHGVEEADDVIGHQSLFNALDAAGGRCTVGPHFRNIDVIIGEIRGKHGPGTAGIGGTVDQYQRFAFPIPHFHIGHGKPVGEFHILFVVYPFFLVNKCW